MLFTRSLPRILCLGMLLPVSALSQGSPSQPVTGQVLDPGGAAITGARVEVHQTDGSASYRVLSDRQGRFVLPPLPSGRFAVEVAHDGFRTEHQALVVSNGHAETLNFTLPVLSLAQSVTVQARSPLMTEAPAGQTRQVVGREDFKNSPAPTAAEILNLVPGVTLVQGNGPRDVSISLRGSNERQTYGVRNTKVFEDGFPLTQPDGLARTDLTDPHAYSSVEVVQGPSSALYGNYATGGAINFHVRSGSELGGLEVGTDVGSFGYLNDYAAYGRGNDRYQIAGFLSNVRATQATANNAYNTVTANILATVAATPRDRFTMKFIDNELDAQLSLRLSLAQYRLRPYQRGCAVSSAAAAANGCASISLFSNGYNGARVSLSAAQAGLGRHDRRTIVGARWEHDLRGDTTWQTQFVADDRDINQPTGSASYRGRYPSLNITSDLLRRGSLGSHSSTTYASGFFNYEHISSYVYNVAPGGNATLGGLVQTVFGKHLNAGGRVREEMALGERWLVVAGLGLEFTGLQAMANNFSYPAAATPVITPVATDRTFLNAAPEVAVQFYPLEVLRLHARLGTGYGTPQATQLFVNAQGQFGNNTTLRTQRNTGVDAGADWQPATALQMTLTGFYEWFHNEQVTQSPGVNLQSFTFNAPASAHRGVEAGLDWHPLMMTLPGLRLRASYLYDNQTYTRYTEQLTTGAVTNRFDREGQRIPGVQPNFLNGRVLYEQPTGPLRGAGAFLEINWRDTYPLDNANLLNAPGTTQLNLSTHYDPPAGHGAFSRMRFLFGVQNLANRTYVASAGNLTNTLNAGGQENGAAVLAMATGSIYAGAPRVSYGGVRVRF